MASDRALPVHMYVISMHLEASQIPYRTGAAGLEYVMNRVLISWLVYMYIEYHSSREPFEYQRI